MQSTSSTLWRSKAYDGIAAYTCMTSPIWLQELVQPLFRDAMIARLRAHTGRRFERAVDLACGVGDWSLRYLRLAKTVLGVDVNGAFVREARRAAKEYAPAEDLSFLEQNLVAFDDYQGADLVCMGACLSCLTDDEVQRVLQRVATALPTAGVLYVRTSVVTPLRAPFEEGLGYYREREFYEGMFHALGLRIVDRAYSATVVADHVAAEWLRCPTPGTRRAVSSSIAVPARLSRVLRRENDFCNWILEKLGSATPVETGASWGKPLRG